LEIDHSSIVGAEVKDKWSYNSPPPIRPHDMDKDFTFIC